jgi:hypothetical protein
MTGHTVKTEIEAQTDIEVKREMGLGARNPESQLPAFSQKVFRTIGVADLGIPNPKKILTPSDKHAAGELLAVLAKEQRVAGRKTVIESEPHTVGQHVEQFERWYPMHQQRLANAQDAMKAAIIAIGNSPQAVTRLGLGSHAVINTEEVMQNLDADNSSSEHSSSLRMLGAVKERTFRRRGLEDSRGEISKEIQGSVEADSIGHEMVRDYVERRARRAIAALFTVFPFTLLDDAVKDEYLRRKKPTVDGGPVQGIPHLWLAGRGDTGTDSESAGLDREIYYVFHSSDNSTDALKDLSRWMTANGFVVSPGDNFFRKHAGDYDVTLVYSIANYNTSAEWSTELAADDTQKMRIHLMLPGHGSLLVGGTTATITEFIDGDHFDLADTFQFLGAYGPGDTSEGEVHLGSGEMFNNSNTEYLYLAMNVVSGIPTTANKGVRNLRKWRIDLTLVFHPRPDARLNVYFFKAGNHYNADDPNPGSGNISMHTNVDPRMVYYENDEDTTTFERAELVQATAREWNSYAGRAELYHASRAVPLIQEMWEDRAKPYDDEFKFMMDAMEAELSDGQMTSAMKTIREQLNYPEFIPSSLHPISSLMLRRTWSMNSPGPEATSTALLLLWVMFHRHMAHAHYSKAVCTMVSQKWAYGLYLARPQ